jgi:hypothetical protein
MSKETLKLALEALKNNVSFLNTSNVKEAHNCRADSLWSIKALEEALAKQEQGNDEYKCTESDAWNCKYCKKMKTCKAIEHPQNFGTPKQEQGEPVSFDTWYSGFNSFVGKSPLLYSDLHCAWQAAKLYTTPQPKQEQRSDSEQLGEPVAWQVNGSMVVREDWIERLHWPFEYVVMGRAIPDGWVPVLYATPQQRKPLTDEQIQAIAKEHIAVGTRSFEEFGRRIEAAHGIKE